MTLWHRGIRFAEKSLENQDRFAAVLKAEAVIVDEIKRQVVAGAVGSSRVLLRVDSGASAQTPMEADYFIWHILEGFTGQMSTEAPGKTLQYCLKLGFIH